MNPALKNDVPGSADHAGKPVVLVVDDHPPVLQALRFLLESKGYDALSAPDGEIACELCRSRRGEISVVITDLMMPGMDGVATIRALRAVDPQLEFIAMSGGASAQEVAELDGLGIKAFLQKPFSVEDMVRALRMALEKHASAPKIP
jgi:CheY-like chemotaxis protein